MSNICTQIIRNHKRFQLNSIRGKRISRYVRLNYADDFIHAITGGVKVAVLTGVLALMSGVLPSHVLASDLPTLSDVSGDCGSCPSCCCSMPAETAFIDFPKFQIPEIVFLQIPDNADNFVIDPGGIPIPLISDNTLDSWVSNSGTIESNGQVFMVASSASDMLETVVNNTGVIRARSLVEGENGEIILSGR